MIGILTNIHVLTRWKKSETSVTLDRTYLELVISVPKYQYAKIELVATIFVNQPTKWNKETTFLYITNFQHNETSMKHNDLKSVTS